MIDINSLENTIRDYLSGDYEVTDTQTIPSIEQVAFGKKAKKIKLCAFCIDMRKSSDLLTVHNKQTCGKIHKAFLTVVSQIVIDLGGEIRSFNGDGLLAFWPANTTDDIGKAIEAGMKINFLLNVKLSPLFEQYEKIDFGIGIDWGDVYIVRAGIPRNSNNNDLVFIGACVNFATAISNQARGPGHVEISKSTYDSLPKSCVFGKKEGQDVDMWKDGVSIWKEEKFPTKVTNWQWKL